MQSTSYTQLGVMPRQAIVHPWMVRYIVRLTKVKSALSLVAHLAGAHPGLRNMKQLRVFVLPPGWDASPSQGNPLALVHRYPFIHLGRERHYES